MCVSLSIYPSEKVKLKTQNKLVCFSGYVVEMDYDYYIYFIGLGFDEYIMMLAPPLFLISTLCFNGGDFTVFLRYGGLKI